MKSITTDKFKEDDSKIGRRAHKLDTEMSEKDVEKLVDAVNNKTLDKFITEYLEINPYVKTYTHKYCEENAALKIDEAQLMKDFVIALGVIKACLLGSEIFDRISYKILNPEYLNCNVATTIDDNGYNIISAALNSKLDMMALVTYVPKLNKEITEKFYLDDYLQDKISDGIRLKYYHFHPMIIVKDILGPLYTESSINECIKPIKEWLYEYYD